MLECVADSDGGLLELRLLSGLARLPFFRSLRGPLAGCGLVLPQEYLEGRRLLGGCDVDDFLEPWYTERDVLGTDSGQMESVESHLRRGLPHALRSDASHHLAGVDQGILEPGLDLFHQPVEGLPREPLLLRAALDDLLRRQVVPEVDLHQASGVSIRRHEKRARLEPRLLIDPDPCLEKLLGSLDDVVWGQIGKLAWTDAEPLPCRPKEPVHVDR